MKQAAKIFIIIGMVVGFWMIIPLIVGFIALKKMETEKPSTGLSICVLLFCNTIAGILLLLSKDEEYGPAAAMAAGQPVDQMAAQPMAQPMEQPMAQPMEQPMAQPMEQPMGMPEQPQDPTNPTM